MGKRTVDDEQVIIQWEDGSLLDQGFGLNPKRVWLDPRLDGTAKALYGFLASYANSGQAGDQVVFPSVITQRKQLGDNGKMLGKDKYYKMRKQLQDCGYLEIRHIRNEDGTIKKVICILKWQIESKTPEENKEPVVDSSQHNRPLSANADSGKCNSPSSLLSANADSGNRGHITEPSFQQKQSLTETNRQTAAAEIAVTSEEPDDGSEANNGLSVGSYNCKESTKTQALTTAVKGQIEGMDRVLDEYHRRIGMLNQTKLRKLEEEVRTFGSDPALLLEAIRITAEQVDRGEVKVGRAINYICGIMTNWRDEGVDSTDELKEEIELEKGSPQQDKMRIAEGMPNAAAYQENYDLVRRWMEFTKTNDA